VDIDPLTLVRSHYENFPVASWLLPKRLRKPIALIYTFARTADDIADEGHAPPQERLAQLDALEKHLLTALKTTHPSTPPWIQALADTMHEHALHLSCFQRLLKAFRQDANFQPYPDYKALRDYCRLSAEPVGALLLSLCRPITPRLLSASNALCSALQLLNFLQDLDEDLSQRQRCTVPLDEQECFYQSWKDWQNMQAQRISLLLEQARPLLLTPSFALTRQLQVTFYAAEQLLDKCQRRSSLKKNVRLSLKDYLAIGGRYLYHFF
jgi:squalene synthase HpnC